MTPKINETQLKYVTLTRTGKVAPYFTAPPKAIVAVIQHIY